jgi:L-alanine-DL-glutamate epimerase-like enolase superfamily enzyme
LLQQSGIFYFYTMILHWQIVQLQLKETFAIAYGNYSFREALIVSLQSHGEKGFGECTAIDYYGINLNEFEADLARIQSAVEQQNISHPTEFYAFLLTLELPSFLRSALDCAYWDLFGKLERRSFLALNQIDFQQLPESSITISVDCVEKQLQKIAQSNWRYFKVKCNHFSESDVIKLYESGRNIALDSNGSFSAQDCLWLESTDWISQFTYLEQPMKKGAEQYANLHSNLLANWMADEDCQSSADLNLLVPHYQSINIKLVKCGGLTPALAMIAEARKLGFKIMIGCMTESTIGISAGAVLAPWCDFADLDGANLIANDLAKGSHIVNGIIQLSEKPGLGIKLS